MSELVGEIERLKEALNKGCIVFIGTYRVLSIDTVKGKKGGLIVVLRTQNGEKMLYANKLFTNYKISVICNFQYSFEINT